MGNNYGKCHNDGYAGMDTREARLLENVFAGLASRSPGRTMDKKTFLDYVEFHGMFGERLFDVFDTKKNKLIDLEEFITGITRFLNGSDRDKIQLLFSMFDLRSDKQITLEELRTMLYSMLQHDTIYKSVSQTHSQGSTGMDSNEKLNALASEKNMSTVLETPKGKADEKFQIPPEEKKLVSKTSSSNSRTPEKDGKKTPKINPELTVRDAPRQELSPGKPRHFIEAEKVDEIIKNAHAKDIDAQTMIAESLIDHTLVNFAKGKDHLTFKEFSAWIEATPEILKFMEIQFRAHVFKKTLKPRAGYLRKRGKLFNALVTRYCVVQDGFLYMFHHDYEVNKGQRPGNGIFLKGLRIVEPLEKRDFPIKLESDVLSRTLYARNAKERKLWLAWLREESKHENIYDEYDIKDKVGEGRFAEVYKCTHKKSGRDYAVKVIDKTKIDDADKEGLRAEIAILRLASHPFIVSMKKVYETKEYIYIVMEWHEHGDLFKTIVTAKFFTEDVSRHIIQQLCSAIRYCHLRGIVHKDIKPENILVEKLDDPYFRIYVTDFGLSQFAKPSEELKDAAGSVAYMAPEMIDSDTFTQSVDVWGIGVITYVVLSGSLPFFDNDENKLMDKIVDQPVEFKSKKWEKISDNAKDFIKKMLTKDPKKRLTISEAMAHPWLKKVDTLIPLIRKKSLPSTEENCGE